MQKMNGLSINKECIHFGDKLEIVLSALFLAGILVLTGCSDGASGSIGSKAKMYDLDSSYHYLVIGEFKGEFDSIVDKLSNSLNGDVSFYQYSKKGDVIYSYMEGEFSDIYYNGPDNIPDSVDSQWGDGIRRTIYYKSPFRENDAFYSIEDGKPTDTIVKVYDSLKRTSTFLIDGEVSTVSYYNTRGLEVKLQSDLMGRNTYESFEYNKYGHLIGKYMVSGKTTTQLLQVNYVYDDKNNWIRKDSKIMRPGRPTLTSTYERTIYY